MKSVLFFPNFVFWQITWVFNYVMKTSHYKTQTRASSRDNITIAAKNFWKLSRGFILPADTYQDLLWKMEFFKFLNSKEMCGLEACLEVYRLYRFRGSRPEVSYIKLHLWDFKKIIWKKTCARVSLSIKSR